MLSHDNPYYVQGSVLSSITSAHVSWLWSHRDPAIEGMGFVWTQGISMQGLTSQDDDEIRFCLDQLKRSHGGTGFMHEVVWKDDASLYRRSWFAWANSLFGEFVWKVAQEQASPASKVANPLAIVIGNSREYTAMGRFRRRITSYSKVTSS